MWLMLSTSGKGRGEGNSGRWNNAALPPAHTTVAITNHRSRLVLLPTRLSSDGLEQWRRGSSRYRESEQGLSRAMRGGHRRCLEYLDRSRRQGVSGAGRTVRLREDDDAPVDRRAGGALQ